VEKILSSAVQWSEESERVRLSAKACENPAITFPIKKKIDTQLLIVRMAALNLGETQIRVVTNESGQKILSWTKRCGSELSDVNLS